MLLAFAIPSSADVLVIGLMPGWEPADNPKRGVRKVALRLRAAALPGVRVETFANKQRDQALRLVRQAVVANPDARLIFYGYSFGGAGVVKLAREVNAPVELTVQVDSFGRGDGKIPTNVRVAANLYQRDGRFVRGASCIRAEDPARTTILGNFRFSYKHDPLPLPPEDYDTWQRRFSARHAMMDADPAVWKKVERLILDAITSSECSTDSPRSAGRSGYPPPRDSPGCGCPAC